MSSDQGLASAHNSSFHAEGFYQQKFTELFSQYRLQEKKIKELENLVKEIEKDHERELQSLVNQFKNKPNYFGTSNSTNYQAETTIQPTCSINLQEGDFNCQSTRNNSVACIKGLEEECSLSQESQSLQNEIKALRETIKKKDTQFNTLKTHFIESENEYDSVLLNYQKTIHELKIKLTSLEQELQRNEKDFKLKVLEREQMVHSLEKEAVRRESEYQFLKRELETLQREYQSQSEALGNLQLVLQALQKEQEEVVAIAVMTSEKENSFLKNEIIQLKKENFELEEKLSSVKLKENRVDRALIEESVHLETIRLLKEKLKFLTFELMKAHGYGEMVSMPENSSIEKVLLKNMLLTYLTSSKKRETLELLSKLLEFDEEDRRKVGLCVGGGESAESRSYGPPLCSKAFNSRNLQATTRREARKDYSTLS
ncbi:thyroid receptor-interacting protein 11-like isoform X2 [Zophobas morio]|uniref:thyroid receptor-interacting protein 11-like isoform X2 n=1 Tax=Zophobas morio TaxID=2755281 RepID=UPI003082ED38